MPAYFVDSSDMSSSQRNDPVIVPVSLAPDPVIDAYKPGIDISLLRKNLTLSIDERFDNHAALQEFARELHASFTVVDAPGYVDHDWMYRHPHLFVEHLNQLGLRVLSGGS